MGVVDEIVCASIFFAFSLKFIGKCIGIAYPHSTYLELTITSLVRLWHRIKYACIRVRFHSAGTEKRQQQQCRRKI